MGDGARQSTSQSGLVSSFSSIPADDSMATVCVPRAALDDLVQVAAYVSFGRRAIDHQPDGAPYPDATARRALGELDDAGLLDENGKQRS